MFVLASTPETIIDSILPDAPPLIKGQGDSTAKVIDVKVIYRCGPIGINDVLNPSNITYYISGCIAMDKIQLKVSGVSLSKSY